MDVPLTGGPARLYLVWITKLAPVATGFAASIAEAQLQTAAPWGSWPSIAIARAALVALEPPARRGGRNTSG